MSELGKITEQLSNIMEMEKELTTVNEAYFNNDFSEIFFDSIGTGANVFREEDNDTNTFMVKFSYLPQGGKFYNTDISAPRKEVDVTEWTSEEKENLEKFKNLQKDVVKDIKLIADEFDLKVKDVLQNKYGLIGY